MSLEYITKVLKEPVTPTQKLILIVLANYSDQHGQSYPSHNRLREITGLATSTIKDNLIKMREVGLVEWVKRNNTSNLYTLLTPPPDGYPPPGAGYNTKAYTKNLSILDLDRINEIFKEVLDKDFYAHSVNSFIGRPRWKELGQLAGKGIVSPKTGKKIDLTSEDFWYKYFEIANSDGHKRWIRSFWDKKPTLRTMLSINQFEAIIERRYG